MSISTRRGDAGETDLMFGRRVKKDHPRVVATGAIDELNAALGLARAGVDAEDELGGFIAAVQDDLIILMGEIATLPADLERYVEKGFQRFGTERLEKLDQRVAEIEEQGLTFEGWAMPGAGGDMVAAHLDLARTVCRRAERDTIGMGEDMARYLNRLSDALWLSARRREAAS